MKSYTISELVDLSTIQKLAETNYQVSGMPIGVIDAIDGSVLVGAGWQDICTLFHRAHPSSLRKCQESDNYIKDHLTDGEACQYRCKNGLWDIGVPVMVANRHLATIFLGQFFYQGETPDRDYFVWQAQRYGYNLSEYLTALDRVPVFTKEKVDSIIAYNRSFSRFMAELAERSLSNFEAEQALRDSEDKFRVLTETSPAAIFLHQEGKIVYANPATAKMLGFAEKELFEMGLWDWLPSGLKDMLRQLDGSCPSPFECRFTTKSGEEKWGYISTGWMEYHGNPAGMVMIHDITIKKEAEEALLLSQFCIDKAGIGIFHSDATGTIFKVNDHACTSLGYSREELCALSVFDIDPDITEEKMSKLKDILDEKGTVTHETTHRRSDGTTFPVEITCNHLDFHGKRCDISFVKDITEHKRQEEALRVSEVRLKMAMDLAKLVQWEFDFESGMFTFDDQFYALYGTTAEREGGNLMSAEDYARKFIPPEESSVVANGVDEVLANSSNQLEHRIIRADGEERFIVVRGEAVRDHTGCIVKIRGANQDITERKRMEEELRLARDELEKRVAERTEQLQKTAEELRASEERYALAIQGSNDGIWDLNLATGEAYHSPRWKSILGYEDDEISCNISEWESRIHPDDYRRVMETCKAYEDGRLTEFRVEHRLRHKDGSYRWVLSRGACLRDADGKSYRVSGSLTDITERKKLEEQLFQSQKMESIGMLAGGVSHDFNNLLTAISGYGQILMETIPRNDELSRENIGNVLKAADRAAELTRGLLAFSRKQTICPKAVHIDSLIGNAGMLIQRIIGEDIEFGTDFPDRNLLVEADPGQIEQVLMNLATNSRDAMPDGGHLCVTAREAVVEEGSEKQFDLPSPGKYALVSVSDTGIGIEKESLGKIFEPFFTTKGVGEGTGLGLSMVHGIIKQHNGSVLVRSEPGRGTQVDIYLPLIAGHAEEEKSKPAAPNSAGMETLLVVEDEEIVKVFLQKIFERAGYRVIVADNGEEAVERFRENDDISLVLSDVIMPRKNGRQMLEEIRRIKPGTKAVFMSGYTADVMQDKGMLDDVTEFITKPVKKDDLLRKVREVLDKD